MTSPRYLTLSPEERRLVDTRPPVRKDGLPVERYEHRLRKRQQQDLADGQHPATRLPLLGVEGATCGQCYYAVRLQHNSRSYWKCQLAGITRGIKTDIRKSWPACSKWLPAEGGRPWEDNDLGRGVSVDELLSGDA